MGKFARRSLVLILTVALIVGGLPLAHAMPCASSAHPVEMAHEHDGMQMAVAGDLDDRLQASPQPSGHDSHGRVALDGCKCLNCGMCATACVAPLLREAVPERRSLAVSYMSVSTALRTALTFVDPGIPIATA
jgi:ferredoxin